ncbi:cat eye syndrome critical region protein [Hyaloscypha finlandica]|nr:cat eye syndrome critical region protein [Hyaloscypha finlandica]
MNGDATPEQKSASIGQLHSPEAPYEEGAFEIPIPDRKSASVKSFFKNRDALIAKEKSQRSDHEFRQSLSPIAQKACLLAGELRARELETFWSTAQNSELEKQELFPGMIFNLAKSHMEKTSLWKICQKMPKGALLHCHLGAMVDLEWVIETAIETEGVCICSLGGGLVSEEVREKADVRILFQKNGNADGSSIWKKGYMSKTWVSLKSAAERFPNGGREGFVQWLKSKCTITQEDNVAHHLGVDEIWRKLQGAFRTIAPIEFYEPITRGFIRRFLLTVKEDGVKWVEMRGMNRNFRLEGEDEHAERRLDLVRVIDEEISTFMKSEEGKGFWGVRLIWDTLRSFNTETIIEDMKFCIQAKKNYPHLISGYDLVGPEDDGRTLRDLTPELMWFQDECAKEGVNIPFFFHAGECVGDGNSTDQNLFDAILFGSRRIGHGFSLYKHPLLIDMVKEKKILIESCPISNEVLRYTASIMSHPLPALLSRGVPASLSNDDPALMGHDTSGMTHDFWQAIQGWENLGLAGLGSLAQNSVRWSNFENQDTQTWLNDISAGVNGTGIRAKRIKEWNKEWEQFCQWIVDEFGSL